MTTEADEWTPGQFIVIQHPEGVEPGTYFAKEFENEWYEREEWGLHARVLVIGASVLCYPTGRKFRRKSDGAIAEVYQPRGKPPEKPKEYKP